MQKNTPIQSQLPEISAVFQSAFSRSIQTNPHPDYPQKNAVVVRVKSCKC
jgi:hypothetical protein